MIRTILFACITIFVITLNSCIKKIDSPLNNTVKSDTLSYITGKWFWYKTLIHDTSGGKTSVDTFYNDYSTYDFSKNHVVYTSEYYKFNNTTANDSMKYFIKGSQLGLVRFTSLTDTFWNDIKYCNSTSLMIYNKSVYEMIYLIFCVLSLVSWLETMELAELF